MAREMLLLGHSNTPGKRALSTPRRNSPKIADDPDFSSYNPFVADFIPLITYIEYFQKTP